ncbi:hypothetical protein [Rhodoluna lacicola]|uniref:hypothetical protein n=1 Tax=Rhodoluna lacicola TaxID=529884 RepID=UPI002230CC4F|nr:hypothetical protein [Rhodoluna lacicola]BDS49840.1 hypothetical protein RKACHI23_01020 [Rhodoluna lacicola]
MKKTFTIAISALCLLAPLTSIDLAQATTISHVSETKAGQFCKKADIGKKKTADNGSKVRCTKDGSRARWKAIN